MTAFNALTVHVASQAGQSGVKFRFGISGDTGGNIHVALKKPEGFFRSMIEKVIFNIGKNTFSLSFFV